MRKSLRRSVPVRSLLATLVAVGVAGCAADNAAEKSEGEASALSGDGITVVSPGDGAAASGAIAIKASVTSCGGVKATAIGYSVDDSPTTNFAPGLTLDTDAPIPAGAHIVHLKAWSGPILCPVIHHAITMSGSAGGGYDGSKLIPSPPSGANLIGKIDELTNWQSSTGPASACPNGVRSKDCDPPDANYNTTVLHVAPPGSPPTGSQGLAAEFQLYSGPAYATVVWGHTIASSLTARRFIWDFDIYLSNESYGNAELDFYQILADHRFMAGTQCNHAANSWDTWNEITQHWVHNPAIKCNDILTANKWHRVIMYLSTDTSDNTYTYNAFRIDGVDYPLNQKQPAHSSNWPNGHIGVQVQLDANGAGNAVNEYVQNMKTYAW